MNAFRKFRMLALVGLVAVLLVGFAGASADAGCHSFGYGYGAYYAPSYSYAPAYHSCYYPTWYVQPYYLNSCYSAFPTTYLP